MAQQRSLADLATMLLETRSLRFCPQA